MYIATLVYISLDVVCFSSISVQLQGKRRASIEQVHASSLQWGCLATKRGCYRMCAVWPIFSQGIWFFLPLFQRKDVSYGSPWHQNSIAWKRLFLTYRFNLETNGFTIV